MMLRLISAVEGDSELVKAIERWGEEDKKEA